MILQLDTENSDRDLTSQVTVLTHTPSATEPIWCKGLVLFGDGTKDLDGTGGDFELTITVGGNTIQPDPQTIAFSTAVRAGVWTTEFPVPANAEVVLKAKSPNAGDSDVDVTAYLYQIDKVDVLAIGGDKQSATDLKDFADTGYDPATHKVEGVKTADTATTAGSVTGNVGGNVAGSVGSVTGAVGSVTGNVGGNVAGSVGSVTGAVGSVVGAVGSVTAPVTVGTNSDKTGYELSAGGVTAVQSGLSTLAVADILTAAVDGSITLAESLKRVNALASGAWIVTDNGDGTSTFDIYADGETSPATPAYSFVVTRATGNRAQV